MSGSIANTTFSHIGPRAQQRLDFNYEFLIFLLLAGLLAIGFLLYVNRAFASIVSYVIRTYTWHQYRVYIDVTALQISLLGGRIFFTGLRYHGSNETFLIQHGYITWRYWLRRVREVDVLVEDTAEEVVDKNRKLPCRIDVHLEGLEWFVYNRSPAYDSVLAGLTDLNQHTSRDSDPGDEKDTEGLRSRRANGRQTADDEKSSRDGHGIDSIEKSQEPLARNRLSDRAGTASRSIAEDAEPLRKVASVPTILHFLPIHVKCHKAAVVVGNENTKGILIVKAEDVLADIDAHKTATPDPYRQNFKVDFQNPVVEMKDNVDYKEDQASRAQGESEDTTSPEMPPPKRNILHRRRRQAMSTLRNLIPSWRKSVESVAAEARTSPSSAAFRVPGAAQWQGLARYVDDHDQDDKARWSSVEYAAVQTVMDCPAATLTIFWDNVGKVPAVAAPYEQSQNINGEESPAWGIHLSIKGGTLNYGPWTDRLRADLQRTFVPSLARDALPTGPLPAGAWRAPTQFKLLVEVDESVTFRIPIREESKNWRWRGKTPAVKPRDMASRRKQRNRQNKASAESSELRPAGWLEVKIPQNSSVSYLMDMFASAQGYSNSLEVELPTCEIWSSVNHDLLWKSGVQRISCDLSNPLSWNTLRNWTFDIISKDLQLFLLRDHIFLLVDLVNDWSTGPQAEYFSFTPFKYHLNLTFENLQLFLNVNDANIIDKATAFEENSFLVLASPRLRAETVIPIDKYRPEQNAIPFDVKADTLDLSLRIPQWNTLATFLASEEIGHLESLSLDGSYHYNATTSTANTDTLVLNVHGQSPSAYLYGFLIRYALLLKDNYFGEHVHFRTLDEYQEQQRLQQENPEAEDPSRPPYKKSNDLDVILSIRTDDPKIMLPTNLYNATQFVQCELASLSVDLRFTNYYMDLELELSPLSLALGQSGADLDSPSLASSNTQLFVDGIRVFGHRLFGLPPTEPTYLCNWDVAVGNIEGELTADFAHALVNCASAFAFTFDDVENALMPYSCLVFYDVTFISIEVHTVKIWLHVDEAAFLLSTDKISVNSNDWARSHYSKRANIEIPNLQLSCVNSESAQRHKIRSNHPIETHAFFKTDIHLAMVGRKFHFTQERSMQQELIRREDQRTQRTPFFLIKDYLGEFIPEPVDPPAQCAPPAPAPINDTADSIDGASWSSRGSSHRSRGLAHKSSFLSLRSTSTKGGDPARKPGRHYNTDHHGSYLNPNNDSQHLGILKREISPSTDMHSDYHSFSGDHIPPHYSVAFSSQYFAPHFSLEGTRPDDSNVPSQNDEPAVQNKLEAVPCTTNLEDIDPDDLSEDHAHTSILIEFPAGISGVLNPASIKYTTMLLDALQPEGPEDTLDALQVGVIDKIFSGKKISHITGKISDTMIRLPHLDLRFLNSSLLDSPDPSVEEQDQYDISVSQLHLILRSTTEGVATIGGPKLDQRSSLHLRLGSIALSASERLSLLQDPQAAFLAQVDDVTVSLGTKEIQSLDVDIGNVVGSTASGKVEYLASLIHRTGNIADELASLFTSMTDRSADRLRLFTYCVLSGGSDINDPFFLIRPSSVLRSATDHMRTEDSWKMMMRLRQIWNKMPHTTRRKIVQKCWIAEPVVPANVKQQALEAFHQWRSWDLEDPAKTRLLQRIFGGDKDRNRSSSTERDLLATVRLGELQLVLDPGPKASKIGILDFTTRAEKRPRRQAHGEAIADTSQSLTVTIDCNEASGNLNWEICELVEDVLRLYARNGDMVPSELGKPSATKPPIFPSMSHIVFQLGTGSFEVQTVNLVATHLSNGVRGSVVISHTDMRLSSQSLMLSCDAVTYRLRSRAQLLGLWQLRTPSVYVCHETRNAGDDLTRSVKVTASNKNLDFAVKQDPLVLLEVADLICRDEISQIHRLTRDLAESKPAPQPPTEAPKQVAGRLKVDVAMFMDSYTVTIPVLQSLSYKITGVVARGACTANEMAEMIFDFDVKENAHEMQINVRNKPQSISIFELPPTNGRITLHNTPSERMVTALSSLELVTLDASAVYSLLAALNRPQIMSAAKEYQEQIKSIQAHVGDIFGHEVSPATQQKGQSRAFVYNVRLVFAGLKVSAKTALRSDLEPAAQVVFLLDRAYFQASNRHEAHGPVSKCPEVHLNIKHIGVNILRGSASKMRTCGRIGAGVTISASSCKGGDGREDWSFNFKSDDLTVDLSSETISTVVGVLAYLSDKIKDLDTSRELDYLRKLRQSRPRITLNDDDPTDDADILDSVLSSVIYHFELRNIRLCWAVGSTTKHQAHDEDLVLSINLIEFGTRTRKSARLTIDNFLLQTVPPGQNKDLRSMHSALLPEVIFNVAYMSTSETRRMAFQAAGQSLDIRLTSGFILPVANLIDSISLSAKNATEAAAGWSVTAPTSRQDQTDKPTVAPKQNSILGKRRIESVLVDVDFDGAVVHMSGKRAAQYGRRASRMPDAAPSGKYGQFNADDSGSSAVLHSPGLAWKAEYRDDGVEDPGLFGEIKVAASSNILYPSVVPLIMDIISSVKQVVSNKDDEPPPPPKLKPQKSGEEENILTADPSAVLGRVKLNMGLRICRQEFSLSCQPIARVAATAFFDNIYFTVNTVTSVEQGNFFAISGSFKHLQASVQHVYSREHTGNIEIDHITLSLMNSKHVSGISGVSAMLKVSPMKVTVNAKQVHDFLLFREIWYPEEMRQGSSAPVPKTATEASQGHLVQRYQEVAATAAFPWTATISIAALDVSIDLGQAIGKSVFAITDFWVSSKKTSDWEQNLCLGFDKVGIDCTGRLSGFVALQDFRLRTSIQWPKREQALNETPLVQASIGFHAFRLKAAFDYQAFLVADITHLELLMYNVREGREGRGDRLVAIFNGEAVQAFGTTTSTAQAVALYQAFMKLHKERRAEFRRSLEEIERFMKRKSSATRSFSLATPSVSKLAEDDESSKSPISLDTDVVVTLKTLNLGVFPSTFSDHQVFKMEALNAYARFAASVEDSRVHSILRMTLGQLRIGLAGVRHVEAPKTLAEISVDNVVERATGSRGGTILKVPQVSAVMQTWQTPRNKHIDYIFKSSFEGKVEVGWNYSRISFIRGMLATHTTALEQIWGKELPMTAVKITGVPEGDEKGEEQQKITAEVDLPQSKYIYVPLEPPVIETPQLRDMGEATPPLEWIGLHRERLPNLTHQIVIVSLLELAGEVEDAYSRILGSS